jgi:predicted transcriptional regulator of viral defense system
MCQPSPASCETCIALLELGSSNRQRSSLVAKSLRTYWIRGPVSAYTLRMKEQVRAQEVLARLGEQGLDFFTTDDLVERLGILPQAAHDVTRRLVAANQAQRLKRGLYAVLEPAYWHRPDAGFVANWYQAAARLAEPADYFLAYYTAMEIHQMLQHPLTTVIAATTEQRRTFDVGPVTFKFVKVAKRKFFGVEKRQIQRAKTVKVADLEKTFLDCANRPDLCGGIEEVFRGFARRAEALDGDRILRYALRLGSPSTTKRLGYLLDAAGYGESAVLVELREIAGRLHHYVPLDPKRPRDGERDTRWEILVNVPLDRLLRTIRT